MALMVKTYAVKTANGGGLRATLERIGTKTGARTRYAVRLTPTGVGIITNEAKTNGTNLADAEVIFRQYVEALNRLALATVTERES